MGTAQFLFSTIYYDNKGRVIQSLSDNIAGGHDIVSSRYDFNGKVLSSYHRHTYPGATPALTTIRTRMGYDNAGRVTEVWKQLNDGVDKRISQQSYDELGQIKTKKLAPDFNGTGLETLEHEYNIRGWLKAVNKEYVTASSGDRFFGFMLGYDAGFSKSQYNGNISGSQWRSKGDGKQRAYGYDYDAVNRLLKADFTQLNNATWDQSEGINFNVKIGDGINATTAYDANGNIKQMQQWGLKLNQSQQVDYLKYTYYENSNRLKSVTDFENDWETRLGDFKTNMSHPLFDSKEALIPASSPSAFNAITDYSYDANGNLITDLNKGLTDWFIPGAAGIQYNHLNLPVFIDAPNGGAYRPTIIYVYDAAGTKLKKIVSDGLGRGSTGKTTTTYVSGMLYETFEKNGDPTHPESYTDQLQFVGHEEGRIRYKKAVGTSPASFEYDYMVKDHLGNVRMVLTEQQQQDIYPAATMEPSLASKESEFYTVDPSRIVSKSSITGMTNIEYPNNNLASAGMINNNPECGTGTLCNTVNSSKMYRLKGTEAKMGLGITLKVMAGDKISVAGKSYYFQNSPGPGANSNIPILDILNSFLGAPLAAVTTSVHGQVSGSTINTGSGTAVINNLLTNQDNQSAANTAKPKAFINVIFFDEQFKSSDFRASMVGANSTVKDHFTDLQNIAVQKNGFVYIYCSNETAVDVFFDNLQVVQERGRILEETHYYPFGLTMAGISSKAAGITPNKEKTFQDQRFDDDLGLNWVQFKWRNHDPQIGRFIEIDPLSEKYVYNSTYAFSENKVTNHVELEGLESVEAGIANVWRTLKADVGSAGNKLVRAIDKIVPFHDKIEEKTVASAPGTVITNGTTVRTTVSLNTTGVWENILNNNTSVGVPLVTNTTQTISFDVKTEFAKTVTIKNSYNSNETLTNEVGGKALVRIKGVPVNIAAAIGMNSEGKVSLSGQAAVGSGETQALIKTKVTSSSAEVGVGASTTTGNTKTTNVFGFTFYK